MIRDDGPIWDAWNAGGPYIGDTQHQTYVFVERRFYGGPGDYVEGGWRLNEFNQTIQPSGDVVFGRSWFWQAIFSQEYDYIGDPEDFGPFEGDPYLLQVPNIKNVRIDRSLDSPAATIQIDIYNQNMTDNLLCDMLGTPGYYTWNQGEDPLVQTRWNREVNAWHNVLTPNAKIVTYQGVGTSDMVLHDAVESGNLVCTGIWLIDEISVRTDGMLSLKGRDMAKLLIEQRLFPLVVPTARYPLKYKRWVPNPDDINAKIPGNFKDISDIVQQILYWTGWGIWQNGSTANTVFGNIESTGIPDSDPDPTKPDKYNFDEDFFDKNPAIDPIQKFKEIVGYNFYVQEDGSAKFASPNIWSFGNFFITGGGTEMIPDIDERHNLTDLTLTYSDKNARTGIMILPKIPDTGIPPEGWFQSNSQDILKGIFKLAIWINEVFKDRWAAMVMAELINQRIVNSTRVYSVASIANPCLTLDDQVWVFERQSATASVFYVKGISTTHDLDSGSYLAQYQLEWLGGTLGVPSNLPAEWLENNESQSLAPVRLNNTPPSGDGTGIITEGGDDLDTEDGDDLDEE